MNMPPEKQVELSKIEGVFIELAYVNLEMDRISLDSYVDLIKAAGSENVILTTDLGQIINDTVAAGWQDYFNILKEKGISQDQLVQMAVDNPHHVMM